MKVYAIIIPERQRVVNILSFIYPILCFRVRAEPTFRKNVVLLEGPDVNEVPRQRRFNLQNLRHIIQGVQSMSIDFELIYSHKFLFLTQSQIMPMGSIEHYILHYTVMFHNPGGCYNSFPLQALELPPGANIFCGSRTMVRHPVKQMY